MRIALLVAMPREYRPLLRLLDPGRMAAVHGYTSWIGEISGREILVLETGIGVRHAAEAARCLVARYSLDLVLSAGFAGGLSPELRVGDVVWSREVATHDAVTDRIQLQYNCGVTPVLEDSLTGLGARPVRFVTVGRLQPKGHLAEMRRQQPWTGQRQPWTRGRRQPWSRWRAPQWPRWPTVRGSPSWACGHQRRGISRDRPGPGCDARPPREVLDASGYSRGPSPAERAALPAAVVG